jgi:hypothetical protein
MVPLTGVPWKNQPTMSYSWLGLISQMKIWMFNVSVPDNYIPVCHLSIKDLEPTSQKGIFYFTTLKGDYHLTASWCYMNNSKSPTFMSPDVLRANACKGSLVSELTKSSNLTGKNSYCILTTGHHKRNLNVSELLVSRRLLPGPGILCLEVGYLFVGRS